MGLHTESRPQRRGQRSTMDLVRCGFACPSYIRPSCAVPAQRCLAQSAPFCGTAGSTARQRRWNSVDFVPAREARPRRGLARSRRPGPPAAARAAPDVRLPLRSQSCRAAPPQYSGSPHRSASQQCCRLLVSCAQTRRARQCRCCRVMSHTVMKDGVSLGTPAHSGVLWGTLGYSGVLAAGRERVHFRTRGALAGQCGAAGHCGAAG